MKRKTVCLVATFFMFAVTVLPGLAGAVSPPKEGGPFPDILFPVPKDKAHRAYLGVPETGTFHVPQIKAQVVIVEVFNMY